jgi:hypothetical protein
MPRKWNEGICVCGHTGHQGLCSATLEDGSTCRCKAFKSFDDRVDRVREILGDRADLILGVEQ